MIIMGVDPGVNTGWCTIDTYEKRLLQFGTAHSPEQFYSILKEQEVDLYVIEDYKVRPTDLNKGWMHQWNDGIAFQIIGAIKYQSWVKDVTFVLQQPAIKPAGYAYMRMEYKKGKSNMHHFDAMCHGFYYCIKNKIMTPMDLREMFSNV